MLSWPAMRRCQCYVKDAGKMKLDDADADGRGHGRLLEGAKQLKGWYVPSLCLPPPSLLHVQGKERKEEKGRSRAAEKRRDNGQRSGKSGKQNKENNATPSLRLPSSTTTTLVPARSSVMHARSTSLQFDLGLRGFASLWHRCCCCFCSVSRAASTRRLAGHAAARLGVLHEQGCLCVKQHASARTSMYEYSAIMSGSTRTIRTRPTSASTGSPTASIITRPRKRNGTWRLPR